MRRYYLDTGTLYNLHKLPDTVKQESFYSVFALMELITGIKDDNFRKRKIALSSAITSGIHCDYTFPEQLIFYAFDVFREYDYIEERTDDLFGIIDDIISSDSFSHFHNKIFLKNRAFDWQYFADRDNYYSKNFNESTIKGIAMIKSILADPNAGKSIEFSGNIYDLSNRRLIVNFLDEPLINSSITILALANEAGRIAKMSSIEFNEEDFYKSYNGNAGIFIETMSKYSIVQILEDRIPGRNDFQDLVHLFYMRNSPEMKIITNDKIFHKLLPEKAVFIEDFSNES
jgi:hypothetical protein